MTRELNVRIMLEEVVSRSDESIRCVIENAIKNTYPYSISSVCVQVETVKPENNKK